jgi:hypothetical protein
MFKFNNPNLFEANSDLHSYNTRNKNNIALPVHSSNTVGKSPYYLTAIFFDHLPLVLRKIKNLNLFKNLLMKLLTDKEYYDVKSFLEDNFTITDILKFVSRSDIENYS